MANFDPTDPGTDPAATAQESDARVSAQEAFGHPLDDDPSADDTPVRNQQWYTRLVDRWLKHHTVNLQLRFDTGEALNRRLGNPGDRQPRGLGVVKLLAAEISVDEGEVSRMRWFSYRAGTLKQFKQEHPELATWDAIRVWLAKEAAEDAGKESSTKQKRPVEGVLKAIRGVTASLPKRETIDDVDRQELLLELQKLARAMREILEVEVTVAKLVEAPTT